MEPAPLSTPLDQDIPQYPVRLGEALLITLGALTLVGIGLSGLWLKALAKTYDPARAEAIAKSLLDYQFPEQSQGFFGINIGAGKYAEIHSNSDPPDVILEVGSSPSNRETTPSLEESVAASLVESPAFFSVTSTRSETRRLCGNPTQITIKQGFQTFGSDAPIPAIRYSARVNDKRRERLVTITTNGPQAREKAEMVFNSLRCK